MGCFVIPFVRFHILVIPLIYDANIIQKDLGTFPIKGILHPHEFSCVSVKEIFKANTKIDAAIYPDNVPISSPQPRDFFLSGDDSAT